MILFQDDFRFRLFPAQNFSETSLHLYFDYMLFPQYSFTQILSSEYKWISRILGSLQSYLSWKFLPQSCFDFLRSTIFAENTARCVWCRRISRERAIFALGNFMSIVTFSLPGDSCLPASCNQVLVLFREVCTINCGRGFAWSWMNVPLWWHGLWWRRMEQLGRRSRGSWGGGGIAYV